MRIGTRWRKKIALLDGAAQLNCIFEHFALSWRLEKVNRPSVEAKIFDTKLTRFTGAYFAEVKIRDGEGREYTFMQTFYVFF